MAFDAWRHAEAVSEQTHRSRSADETERLGFALASQLQPGDVVLIAGELGSGKTTLVRGICRALGVAAPVTSPTFALSHRYDSDAGELAHLDLYRLGTLSSEEQSLFADEITDATFAFLEWPDNVLPQLDLANQAAWRIELTHAGEDQRQILVTRAECFGQAP